MFDSLESIEVGKRYNVKSTQHTQMRTSTECFAHVFVNYFYA